MNRTHLALLMAVGLGLSACSSDDTADATPSTQATTTAATPSAADAAAALSAAAARTSSQRTSQRTDQRRALAAGSIDALDAANQLMDHAEVWFPQFFPEHATTGEALGYTYRAYSTGIYLGVREGRVYVLGGTFGNDVVPVGALTDFISPQPRQLSTLCANGVAQDSFATPGAAVGRNAGVTLAGCTGAIGTVRWQQTAGPSVSMAADRTQTLSFDPPQAGMYTFRADYTDANGAARSRSVSLAVAAATATADGTGLTVRASHSVRMGGKVSVRAWPTMAEGDSVKAVTWTQIEGPAVTLDLKTSRLALFTAPEVPRDTLVRLRATLHTTAGRTASDEVMVLVERQVQPARNNDYAIWAGEHVPRVLPYLANSKHAGVLRRCVFDPGTQWDQPYNLCSIATLPFLADESGGAIPTVEQVMGRVLVSHDWLGRNFEAFLRTHDTRGDFRRMLNSTTAIVLSTHVRPSFYYAMTGAIYLDADSFWLTPEERDTVNESPDYRNDFGSALQYATLWRYVKDGEPIRKPADPRERVTRTLADVHPVIAALLYHELGHALDYLPPAAYGAMDRRWGVWENIYDRYAARQLTSDVVSRTYPLTSSVMFDLAQVQFRGATPSAAQKALTALQVADEFRVDLATDDYAYNTPFEDVAMTLEEVLMQRRLGIRRDFAITDPFGADATSASIVVRWGQRGRIGEPALKPRAKAVVQALTPWLDAAEVDQLPAPIALRAGESWKDNLAQPSPPRRAAAVHGAPTLEQAAEFQRELQHMRQHRHTGFGPHRDMGFGPHRGVGPSPQRAPVSRTGALPPANAYQAAALPRR